MQVARRLVEEQHRSDPYRLECLSVLGDILAADHEKTQLYALTAECLAIDPFSPETCFVNAKMYEEVLNLPLRASLAYQRALRILCPVARGLASVGERALVTRVWLASGHCYTELASAETALHCFLRGTESDPSDWRLWYNVGHTYEMMNAFEVASHFYRTACRIMPRDPRTWFSLGECLLQTSRKEEAEVAYTRSAELGDPEHLSFIRLAEIWELQLAAASKNVPASKQLTQRAALARTAYVERVHSHHTARDFSPIGILRNELFTTFYVTSLLKVCEHYVQTGAREEALPILTQITTAPNLPERQMAGARRLLRDATSAAAPPRATPPAAPAAAGESVAARTRSKQASHQTRPT